jgi:hypothetical protein
MRKYWFTICAAILAIMAAQIGVSQYASAHSESPSLVTFTNGQILTHTDLNNSLAHIHNTLSGGITNTHISASAAIAYSKLNLAGSLVNADLAAGAAITASKLAVPSMLPVAWAVVQSTCSTSPCTIVASNNVTSITRSGTGEYVVNLTAARSNANGVTMAQSVSGILAGDVCFATTGSTTAIQIGCFDSALGGATDAAFHVVIWGN